MTNQLTAYQDFTQISQAADALFKSGFFSDLKSVSQAVVKVMAGAELGIPPFASVTGINIIQGKPTLGANVIATLVKNDPRYDYNLAKCDENEAVIDWYENGKKRGQSSFTIKEAQIAGLTGKDNWRKYPSDMLFARAISRGARRFAPGIFGGSPVYTPDELGVETDPEGYIDATHVTVTEPTQAEPAYPPEAADVDREENEAPDYSQVKNSDGVLYSEIPAETLAHMATQMTKSLAKNDVLPERKAELQTKLDAAKHYMAKRA